jgi:hypothetical protein
MCIYISVKRQNQSLSVTSFQDADSHDWCLFSNTFLHCGLLGYDTVYSDKCVPVFQWLNLQPGYYTANEKGINCNTLIKFHQIHKLLMPVFNKEKLS